MKKPPLNKFFKTTSKWYSYDTEGNSCSHGPEEVIAIIHEDSRGWEYYSFIHSGQPFQDEALSLPITNWEELCADNKELADLLEDSAAILEDSNAASYAEDEIKDLRREAKRLCEEDV